MSLLQRRTFLGGMTIAAGAAIATSGTSAQTSPPPRGTSPMVYAPKPFSLDPKNVKGISERVLVSHYENNYLGAVMR